MAEHHNRRVMAGPDSEISDDGGDKSIIVAARLVHVHLLFGNYNNAKMEYAHLKQLIGGLSHDAMVRLVNLVGVIESAAGWIAKGWSENNGLRDTIVEFETAECFATVGESFDYRRGKKTWGDLVSITNDDLAAERFQVGGEKALRMAFFLKENNTIRCKQTTRNEVRAIFGSALVTDAMRSNKGAFIKELSPADKLRIEQLAGLSAGELWTAVKKGDRELVNRLMRIPSAKREQMRRRGMFVADPYEPQLQLFA